MSARSPLHHLFRARLMGVALLLFLPVAAARASCIVPTAVVAAAEASSTVPPIAVAGTADPTAPPPIMALPLRDSIGSGSTLCKEAQRAGGAGWSTVTAPFRWQGEDALKAGGILAGTAAAFLLDGEVKRLVERNRTEGLDRTENVVVRYGDTRTVILLTGGVTLTGLLAGDRWLRETGLLMGTALIITSTGVQLMKLAIGRARPYTGRGTHLFVPFTGDNDLQAFPSGHSAAAFTVSSVLAARIDNPWATAGLYGLAAATALSRIYSGNHWFSDVLFSALTASAVGRTIVRIFEEAEGTDSGLRIYPSSEGIFLVYSF